MRRISLPVHNRLYRNNQPLILHLCQPFPDTGTGGGTVIHKDRRQSLNIDKSNYALNHRLLLSGIARCYQGNPQVLDTFHAFHGFYELRPQNR